MIQMEPIGKRNAGLDFQRAYDHTTSETEYDIKEETESTVYW